MLPFIVFSSLLFNIILPGSIRPAKPVGTQSSAAAPLTAPPATNHPGLPVNSSRFKSFIQRVTNGNAKQVVGIFANGEFAHPIVQQPSDQSVYVSSDPDQVTQFGLPSRYGSIGLLAHNNLAGNDFYKLGIGSHFSLVYGNGTTRTFRVTEIHEFQALDPENPYSNFLDTQTTGPELTSADLFRKVYTHTGDVVFQTCIERDGEASWGRRFITAKPETQEQPLPQTRLEFAAAF